MSEQDNQVVEATNSADDQEILIDLDELPEVSEIEDISSLREQLEREKTARQQLTARAKKAEDELKGIRQKATQTISNQNLSQDDIAATVLRAQGMDIDLLNELKALSKVRNKPLLEVQDDPIFIALKKNKEDERREKKAQLGASRSSGQVKKAETITTPGLSKDKHIELWRELNNK